MAEPVPEISACDLAARLAGGEHLVLLDVREPHERAICAIPAPLNVDDLHVPMSQVPGELEALRDACEGHSIVVYCHHGVRSLRVAGWLSAQGVSGLLNLAGGIHAWAEEVDPRFPRY